MSGHGHGADHGADHGSGNKRIALLISVLALVLAFSETLGKAAQTTALNQNVEASNLWAFFQAKTIRQTTLRATAKALLYRSHPIMEAKRILKQVSVAGSEIGVAAPKFCHQLDHGQIA
jgi:hypothetical protein